MSLAMLTQQLKSQLFWMPGRRLGLQMLGPATIYRGKTARLLQHQRPRKTTPGLPFGVMRSSLPGSKTKVDYHCSGIPWALARISTTNAAHDLMTLLDHMKLDYHHVDLHFCGDKLIRELNYMHRNEDKATDVISLAVPDEMKKDQLQLGLLGEMFISIETARVQAKARGIPLSDELRILAVHSVLHLLGHDHLTQADSAKMEAKENAILAELNWTPKNIQGGLLTGGDVLDDDSKRTSTARDILYAKETAAIKKEQAKKAKKKKKKKLAPQSVLGNKSKKGKSYKPVAWKK
jgi:probable rRNA maturation factor